MLANQVPGTAAQVLSAVLRDAPGPAGGRATFSLVNLPDLPSLATEVVWLPQYAVLDANGEFTGMLVSQGWATKGVTAVTSAYAPQPSDAVILCDATSAAFTVTLPDATQPGYSPGQRYTIVKTDSSAHAVTVNASAGQLIGGGSSVSLTTASGFTSVVFDGVNTNNWWIWAASATSSGSPTGSAGGALSGSYPNPGLAVPVAVSGTSNLPLVTVTNGQSGPTSPSLGVVSATAGDRAIGAEVTGDSNYRLRVGSDGKLQWGPGNATQDTTLSRASAGVLATDTSTSFDVGGHALGAVQPSEHGMVAWAFDPSDCAGNSGLTNGTVYLTGVYVNQSANITKIWWSVGAAAQTATSGQNFVGLYNSAGTRLVTAGVDSSVTVNGTYGTTVTSTAVTPGMYWVGIVANCSGSPATVSVGRGQSVGTGVNNANLSGATLRWATNGTGQTSLPSSITPSSNSASQPCLWAGIG